MSKIRHIEISPVKIQDLDAESVILQNSADVEYYAGVRQVLPTLVDTAVKATMDSKKKSAGNDLENYKKMVESSLKNLKKLMIFYRVRENKQVCEILIRATINE